MNHQPLPQGISPGIAKPALLPPLPSELDPIEPELSAGPNQDTPEPGLDPTLPFNPVRGAAGHQVPDSLNDDEDSEGRNTSEQLFEKGAKAAERDKVNHAAHPEARPKAKAVWPE
ncbi:MAG: hypothetical protein PSU94_16970 [Lacunisphaera sp.]|nr:hypothetical protein [Lacunisphaera sp.]